MHKTCYALLCITDFNAVDAMEGKGKLSINVDNINVSINSINMPAGEYVVLEVTDTGIGMSDDTISKAFEPFFTTKPEGEGTGLGLSRVWGIVAEHGGVVDVKSAIGRGTTFTITFPALGLLDQDPGVKKSVPPVSASEATWVLLVDDEPLIRKSGQRLLKKLGYHVVLAENGADAIEKFDEHKDKLSLILLDMTMPLMNGEEAFYKIREIKNDVPVLICSGYSKEGAAQRLLQQDKVGFIQKPFSVGALTNQMAAIIEK